MKIQIEDLTVSSLAPTTAEDDYELYLHTVLDLDPEDEIVTASPFSSTGLDHNLVESCERVAHYFVDETISGHTEILDTPPASPIVSDAPDQDVLDGPIVALSPPEEESEMGRFIQTSPYFPTLDFLHSVGKMCPRALPGILPSVINEAQQLLSFQKHLGRIVKQIAHRYPRMNILGLTDHKFTFTEHILQGLQDSYRSYTIGYETEEYLDNHLLSLKSNKKVFFGPVSLNQSEKHRSIHCHLYDLVILSVSVCGNDSFSRVSALKTIRKLIKSGGFLVLINVPPSLRCYSKTLKAPENNHLQFPVTPPDWSEFLVSTAECGFVSSSRNADQYHPLGLSLSVRQADSIPTEGIFNPRICLRTNELPVTDHLVLIGGQRGGDINNLSRDLTILLHYKCKRRTVVRNPSEVTPDIAAACTAVIILTDLEEPVCVSMTAHQLAALKALMRPGMIILWVTSHARMVPEKAASLGLTRTLKAEIPSLKLQVLDLDNVCEGSLTMIAREFCLLAYCAQSSQVDESGALLWSHEPEIHISNGKRLIPRVLPYNPAIERLNSYRRPVSTTVNTLETCVVLKSTQVTDGSIKYRAQIAGGAMSRCTEARSANIMYVEYSSPSPVSIDQYGGVYVCVGRVAGDSGQLSAALSSELASIVNVHHLLSQDLSNSNSDPSQLASTLSQVLSAFELVENAQRRNIVLIGPGQAFLRCVRRLISNTFKEKRINVQAWSCDETSCRDSQTLFIHPWSSAREIRNHLPDDCAVHDFLPEGSQLTRTLFTLSNQVQYRRGAGNRPLNGEGTRGHLGPDEDSVALWKQALELSLLELASQESSNGDMPCLATPSRLLDIPIPPSSFSIVDWKADRNLQIDIQPVMESQYLRNDRTYVLIGLTRDLGQSLCRLFIDHGARNLIVASRTPDMSPAWVSELNTAGARIHITRLDVTILEDVKNLQAEIVSGRLGMPPVGGVVNGAMVLDDRVFAQMDMDTWTRVLRPKTVGSRNLDVVFDAADLQFFIMTSSFAAVGGHAGQSNYAAANMYMNGLAADRRRRGLAGSVLNIGVIYGLGLLARERPQMYHGLEREGYPPISERDLHHMFIEAIEAGRPVPGQIADLTTGLARFRVDGPDPLHWHRDQRFCHYTVHHSGDEDEHVIQQDGNQKHSIKDLLKLAQTVEAAAEILQESLCRRVEIILQLPVDNISGDSRIAEVGIDSLAAVEIRNWFYKSVGQDIAVLKILGASCISQREHGPLSLSCL